MAGICLPVPGTRQEAAITQMSSGHSKFPRWRNKWRRTSPTGCSCGKRKSSTYKTEYTPPPAGTARKACDPPIIKMWKGEWRESGKAAPAAKSAASAGAGASRSVLRPKAVSHRQEEKETVGDLAALHGTPNIGGDRSQEGSPLAAADLQPVLPNLDHIVLDRPHIPQIDKVTLVAFGKVVGGQLLFSIL